MTKLSKHEIQFKSQIVPFPQIGKSQLRIVLVTIIIELNVHPNKRRVGCKRKRVRQVLRISLERGVKANLFLNWATPHYRSSTSDLRLILFLRSIFLLDLWAWNSLAVKRINEATKNHLVFSFHFEA